MASVQPLAGARCGLTRWVVPGAPLEEGRGWRLWYSQPGRDPFRPTDPTVTRSGQPEGTAATWELFDPPAGVDFDRRMGLLTVTLDNPLPGAFYELAVPDVDPPGPLALRSLPAGVGDGVSFLFTSCFWMPNDKEGAYAAGVRDLGRLYQPAFKLLIGDQVYQDYPVNWELPKSSFSLYAERYEQYWRDPAYQEVLRATPNFFIADDHEFWNDFPERQVHLPRTYTREGREGLREAATALYERYQQWANPGRAAHYSFGIGSPGGAVPPVSFFLADARSQRSDFASPHPHFFVDEQWKALEAWAAGLQGPGVLVLGQPLYQRDGDWKDHSLSNFAEDYGRLCAVFERALLGKAGEQTGSSVGGQPHDILILTGDIHSCRYCVGTIAGLPGTADVHELVASPASRVGPYVRDAVPQQPPTKFTARYGDNPPLTWNVVMPPVEGIPSVDNNVGSVRMSPGTNGRVRFEMTLWRIRPYDARSVASRMLRRGQPQGRLAPLLQREIELR